MRNLSDYIPFSPMTGPPFPRFLNIKWPWATVAPTPTRPQTPPEVPPAPVEPPTPGMGDVITPVVAEPFPGFDPPPLTIEIFDKHGNLVSGLQHAPEYDLTNWNLITNPDRIFAYDGRYYDARLVVIPLTPGETYTVKVTVANISTRGGQAWPATMSLKVKANAGSFTLLPETTKTENYAAAESKVFNFNMVVPVSAGGQIGALTATISDPEGNTVAAGSADISVAQAAQGSLTLTLSTVERFRAFTYFPKITGRVTNSSSGPVANRMVYLYTSYRSRTSGNLITQSSPFSTALRIYGAPQSPEWPQGFTLSPGQSVDVTFVGQNDMPNDIVAVPGTPGSGISVWLQDDVGVKSNVIEV